MQQTLPSSLMRWSPYPALAPPTGPTITILPAVPEPSTMHGVGNRRHGRPRRKHIPNCIHADPSPTRTIVPVLKPYSLMSHPPLASRLMNSSHLPALGRRRRYFNNSKWWLWWVQLFWNNYQGTGRRPHRNTGSSYTVTVPIATDVRIRNDKPPQATSPTLMTSR